MKPATMLAQSLTDAELDARRRRLAIEIPRMQAEYDALQREHRQRKHRRSREPKVSHANPA